MRFFFVNVILALIAAGGLWMITRPTEKHTGARHKDGG